MTAKRAAPPAAGGAFTVTSMGRSAGGVRMTLAVAGAPDIVVILTARDDKPAWGVTRHLSIQYAGSTLTTAQEDALRLVAAALADLTFDAIAAKVPAAAEDAPQARDADGGPAGDRAHEIVTVDEWGNPDRWRTFIFRREFLRNASSMIRLTGVDLVTVSHGESECQFATPQIDGRTMSLYSYPWVRPLERPDRPRVEGRDTGLPGYITTDLRDSDIITGGTARLEEVLDGLAGRTRDGDMVMVSSTCVPHVIGDDMEGAVSRWHGKGRIVYNDVFAKEGTDVTGDLLVGAVAKGPPARGRKGPPAVSIAGLAPGDAFDEIGRMLSAAGVEIACALVPGIDLTAAARWRGARAQVLVPNPYYRGLYDRAFRPLKMTTLEPPAPYGIAATEAWLTAVARSCGRGPAMKKAWRAAREAAGPAIERIRGEASGRRLGFVIAPGDYEALCDPMATAGIPILDVIVELGFGLVFFVYAPADDAPPLALRPAHAGVATVATFSDPASLDALLRGDGCDAVYSDLYGDERITEAGKMPFSLQSFEPGLAGALRTGGRLAGAAAATFYRTYGSHARPA